MWNILLKGLQGEIVFFVGETGEPIGVIPVAGQASCFEESETMRGFRINLNKFNDRTGRPLAELVSEFGGG